MSPQAFLEILRSALGAAARAETKSERRAAFTPLLDATIGYAEAVARGEAAWDAARSGASEHAALAIEAYRAFEAWSASIAEDFYGGGEEEAERALTGHSAFTLLCDLFRGTDAEEHLAPLSSAEVEDDYRRAAEELSLEAPRWVPRSHAWWHWPAT